MNRESWRHARRAESDYAAELWRVFSKVYEESQTSGIAVELLSTAEFLLAYATQAATRMITGLYFAGAKTWREAARESTKTALIYRALQQEMAGPVGVRVRELIRENAKLISTFPSSVARTMVARAAARQQQMGGRSAELAVGGLSALGVARSRARLIARTEVSKASVALTRARSEQLEIPCYVWETSQDQRVRPSHRKMQGVVVFWDKPPAPEALIGEKSHGHYQAGETFNCRCYSAPVVKAEILSWPRRVYYDGAVRQMTLAKFNKINRIQEAAA